MQERHDNDKIEPHNHNEYPLLYKKAELLTSVLGKFLECRKWNILVITWALGIFLIYMPVPSGLRPSGLGIYIRQIPLAHVITITYTQFYTRTVWPKILTGENIDEFDEFLAICQNFTFQSFLFQSCYM